MAPGRAGGGRAMSDETPQWIKDMEPKRESIVDKMFPRRDPGDARERVRTRT